MRRALPLLALSATLALAGCGGGSDDASGGSRYSSEVRENFLDSCLQNATNTAGAQASQEQLTRTCECILGKVEAEFSEKDFRRFEERLLSGTASDAESTKLVDWSNECAQESTQ